MHSGLDIKENYHNVLRFDFFADAGVWTNVGVGNPATDEVVKNLNEMRSTFPFVNRTFDPCSIIIDEKENMKN